MRRSMWMLALAVALISFSAPCHAALRESSWDGLQSLKGKHVRIAMPGGAVIAGRLQSVDPDALILSVEKTTDPKAFPKGQTRVLRADLKVLELREKTVRYRIIGTVLGATAGTAAGVGVALAACPILSAHCNNAGAAVALAGLAAGGTTLGYLLGNAGDRRYTTIVIRE